ncbi:unnamed protein product [Ixodes hexagonus]
MQVGKLIQATSGKSNTKRVTLEMGGKCPLVVFPDVDLDEAVSIAHQGAFANMGQVCVSTSRLYVHEDIYEKFLAKSKTLAEKRRAQIGDPFEDKTEHGPQV